VKADSLYVICTRFKVTTFYPFRSLGESSGIFLSTVTFRSLKVQYQAVTLAFLEFLEEPVFSIPSRQTNAKTIVRKRKEEKKGKGKKKKGRRRSRRKTFPCLRNATDRRKVFAREIDFHRACHVSRGVPSGGIRGT